MGYSKSITTVRRYWSYIDQFIAKPPSITWIESSEAEADKLAYKLRECRTIINGQPEAFPQLRGIMGLYTISAKGVTVTASQLAVRAIGAKPVESHSAAGVQHAASVPEVIQGWIDAQPCDTFSVERAMLTTPEVEEVALWAHNMGLEMKPSGMGLRFSKVVSS